MPKVSILVPAFRPQFLDACIASALAQTFRDFELVISDDSYGDDVASVVAKWPDPRIRYMRNPTPQVRGSNRDHLIEQASGKYIKFLFDDDLLMPPSVEVLCAAAEQTGAGLVFHGWHQIDEAGRTAEAPMAIPEGQAVAVTREQFFELGIASIRNFVGGPVSVLIEAKALAAMPNPFGLGGDRMRFLTDMSLYANFASREPLLVGLGTRLSAWRVHGQQTSDPRSPIRSAGYFEWEYLARWAADNWRLDRGRCAAAIAKQHGWYEHVIDRFPQLSRFVELGPLPDGSGSFLTPAFREALEAAWALIDDTGSIVPDATAETDGASRRESGGG